jgi:hypothetical protein
MTDLLASELQRLRWRGLPRGLLLTALAAALAAGVIIFVHTAKHPFDPATGFRGAIIDAAAPLALAAFLLGASQLGADYTSRALTTLLTWEPRRSRVLGARALATALVAAGLSVAAVMAAVLALVPAALAHGTGTSLTTSALVSAAATALRCTLLASVASVAGVGLAALGRSTAAAVAALVVYLVVVEQTVNRLAPSVWRSLIIADALSWVTAKGHIGGGAPGAPVRGHAAVTAGLLLLGAAVLVHTLATVVVPRRDIA